MKIANPMYDVVFKYLIEDVKCAKLLLGEIIQKEIIACELLHNEIATDGASGSNSGILKMDFKALVITGEGRQLLVIIEVQKAIKESNLLRFRQYLGSQYTNKDNFYTKNRKRIPYPIFSIYILGYNVDIDNTIPIIKISPKCYDYTTGSEIHKTSIFSESLSHEIVIVQTKVLKSSKRSLLEGFLSNFMPGGQHFLEINARDYDRKYLSLLKRLEQATMKKEIVELMQRENVLQEEWDCMVQSLEKAKLDMAKVEAEKDIEQKQKQEALKREEAILRISVQTFFDLGMSKESIAEKLNISLVQVIQMLS